MPDLVYLGFMFVLIALALGVASLADTGMELFFRWVNRDE